MLRSGWHLDPSERPDAAEFLRFLSKQLRKQTKRELIARQQDITRKKRSSSSKRKEKGLDGKERRHSDNRRNKRGQHEESLIGPLRASTVSTPSSATQTPPWVHRLTMAGSPKISPLQGLQPGANPGVFATDMIERQILSKMKCDSVEEKAVIRADYLEEVGTISCLIAPPTASIDDQAIAVIGGSEKGFILFWNAEVC